MIERDEPARAKITKLGWTLDENGKNYAVQTIRGKRVVNQSTSMYLHEAEAFKSRREKTYATSHYYTFKIIERITFGSVS